MEGDDLTCGPCAKALYSTSTSKKFSLNLDEFNAYQRNPAAAEQAANKSRRDKHSGDIVRLKIVPVMLRGLPFKANWLIASGALGLVGCVFGLTKIVDSGWWFALGGAFGVVLAVGVQLMRQRYFWISSKNIFELNAAGEVFRTQIGGHCPVCAGKLKVIVVPRSESKTPVVRCTANANHTWSFNSGLLSDL
ncbi:hypothetical protein RAS12_03995 [Achromobacter seleniivolatilans]|uniref:Uncharacterized protein n=1 Tax=Achromobacter seleniivolatilans TaxID=3047478 RepID=A0ABY9M4N3_9BURK|nr:hypothetical protein [Achromobacter sp. R39]WMD21544.1 hypothetical protein RAS12_03995 [Achromobacter sp. R39]